MFLQYVYDTDGRFVFSRTLAVEDDWRDGRVDDAPRASAWMDDGWMVDGIRMGWDRIGADRAGQRVERASERTTAGERCRRAGIVSRAGVAVGGTSATMRKHLRGDRAGRGDGVRRPMTTRTTRMTVARRKGEEKTRGRKGDKRDKRGSNKKNETKTQTTRGWRENAQDWFDAEVPEAIPGCWNRLLVPRCTRRSQWFAPAKLLFGKRSGSRGSLGDLEERGCWIRTKGRKVLQGMMKSVHTIEILTHRRANLAARAPSTIGGR